MPPSTTLLPMPRCSAVAAALAKLQLTPQQGKQAVLQVLERSAPAPDLSHERAAELLECLPR